MPYLPLKDAADYLGLNYGTLRNWRARGKITPTDVGAPGAPGYLPGVYDTDAILAVRPRRNVKAPPARRGSRATRPVRIELPWETADNLKRLQVAFGKSASDIIGHLIQTAAKTIL